MAEKVKSPDKRDTFDEIMNGLEQLKSEIEWILNNASVSGKPFSKRHKEIIRSSMLMSLRDQADEALIQYCFGDAEYGLDSLNNLRVRMVRFEEAGI